MKKPSLITFSKVGASDLGFISVAEGMMLPFEVRRVYWTYFTPQDVLRGNHAHKTLEQIIVAVNGKIEFQLETKDAQKYNFVLDQPDIGLYIPKLVWRTIRFSHSAVLLCLASDVYKEEDYIRDYQQFKLC